MSAGSDPQTDRATDPAVAFWDLFDPGFQPDAPAVHAAREACWYARTSQGYAVLRYDEVVALLRDRRLRQGSAEPLAAQGITEGLLADWMRMSLLTQEGEPHARLRRLVSQAFTPRAVDALRPTMRATAHELIDGFAARGACEFMAAFADPYPSRIIARCSASRASATRNSTAGPPIWASSSATPWPSTAPGSRRRSWAWPPASTTCSPSDAPPPDPT